MFTYDTREPRKAYTDENGKLHSVDYIEGHCLPGDALPTEDIFNGSTVIIMDGTGSNLTPRVAMFDAENQVWKVSGGTEGGGG
ncbi:MAG: hypothetical protein J6X53_02925 [Abditibacteriota bacterium]|nr:hypothetical protein [Abditibacteriota bacterium]